MKKTSILSAILAGTLWAFGGFGCSHDNKDTTAPNTYQSGQAGSTTGSGDVQVSPPADQSQTPGTTPGGQMDQSQQPMSPDPAQPGTGTSPGGTTEQQPK